MELRSDRRLPLGGERDRVSQSGPRGRWFAIGAELYATGARSGCIDELIERITALAPDIPAHYAQEYRCAPGPNSNPFPAGCARGRKLETIFPRTPDPASNLPWAALLRSAAVGRAFSFQSQGFSPSR